MADGFLYGYFDDKTKITKGLWGEISENFVRNTTGDVICHIGGKREKC